MKATLPALVLAMVSSSLPAPPKGFNYDETQVPDYELPDPLVAGGIDIETRADWESKGRPATLALFEEHVYGTRPPAVAETSLRIASSSEAFGGKGHRVLGQLHLGMGEEAPVIDVLFYLPAKATGPVPAFLGLNFNGNHTVENDPSIPLARGWVRKHGKAREEDRGTNAHRWPVEQILDAGFAVATAYCGDIAPDDAGRWLTGAARAFPADATKDPEFSCIGLWAWGLSQIREGLVAQQGISDEVYVIGHSRLGKTALWAAAADPKFAGVVSNNSGCGGAALSRRCFGETVKRINTNFPHWFNAKFKSYNDREHRCPVDQHQLIALAAPRPVYVASASKDLWADPHGEFRSLAGAGPVFALYDMAVPQKRPGPGEAVGAGPLRAHLRDGAHEILDWDWERYLEWARKAGAGR